MWFALTAKGREINTLNQLPACLPRTKVWVFSSTLEISHGGWLRTSDLRIYDTEEAEWRMSHSGAATHRARRPCWGTELPLQPALQLISSHSGTPPAPTPVTDLQGLAHSAPVELSSFICSASFKTQVKYHHSLHLFKTTDAYLLPSPNWAKLKDRRHVYLFYTASVPGSMCVRGGGDISGTGEMRQVAWFGVSSWCTTGNSI